MKKIIAILMICLVFTITSCEVVAGIFKAGMGFGIFIVVAIVALILFVIFKARKR